MQDQPNALPSTRQVFHHAPIAAVEAGGWLLTQRTQRARRGRGDVEHQLIIVLFHLRQFQSLAEWEELSGFHPGMVLRPLGGTDELDRANAHLWNNM